MLLSGFSMVRNAEQLYYPIGEVVKSALPIVDEFVISVGKSDPGDHTLSLLESLGDDKLKLYHRVWDYQLNLDGEIFAHETDFALDHCQGAWCLYLQADEIIHENDWNTILFYCKKYLNDLSVDGFLFKYYHFWGDYDRIVDTHSIIRREIRIVRNKIGIRSYKDALSFRKKDNTKLKVVEIPAYIYHYGYIRPPRLMKSKKIVQDAYHHNGTPVFELTEDRFDFGPLRGYQPFRGTHPRVMHNRIESMFWRDELDYTTKLVYSKSPLRQHKLKYRIITWLENKFNDRNIIMGIGWKNYKLLAKETQHISAAKPDNTAEQLVDQPT